MGLVIREKHFRRLSINDFGPVEDLDERNFGSSSDEYGCLSFDSICVWNASRDCDIGEDAIVGMYV